MRHGKLTWIAACALALGLTAAGCGGDDGNDDETEATTDTVVAESLSKAEFVEQANQICREGNQEIQQAGQELGQGSSEEEVNSFVTDQLIPSIQGQIDEIRSLGIPEGDEAEINGTFDDAEADLARLEDDPSLIQSDSDLFVDVNKRLDEYGLTACAG